MPDDLLEEGRRKITGLATKEHAEAEKAFTETEDQKIDIELKQRALQSDLRKREADAILANTEADLKEVQVLDARFVLEHGQLNNFWIVRQRSRTPKSRIFRPQCLPGVRG